MFILIFCQDIEQVVTDMGLVFKESDTVAYQDIGYLIKVAPEN